MPKSKILNDKVNQLLKRIDELQPEPGEPGPKEYAEAINGLIMLYNELGDSYFSKDTANPYEALMWYRKAVDYSDSYAIEQITKIYLMQNSTITLPINDDAAYYYRYDYTRITTQALLLLKNCKDNCGLQSQYYHAVTVFKPWRDKLFGSELRDLIIRAPNEIAEMLLNDTLVELRQKLFFLKLFVKIVMKSVHNKEETIKMVFDKLNELANEQNETLKLKYTPGWYLGGL